MSEEFENTESLSKSKNNSIFIDLSLPLEKINLFVKINLKSGTYLKVALEIAVCGFETIEVNDEADITLEYSSTTGDFPILLGGNGDVLQSNISYCPITSITLSSSKSDTNSSVQYAVFFKKASSILVSGSEMYYDRLINETYTIYLIGTTASQVQAYKEIKLVKSAVDCT